MLPIIPAYSAPSTTNIAPTLTNASADVKNLVESSNGVNSRLAQLSNNAKRELTVSDDGAALNANQDVNIFLNATGGPFALTLPPLSGQYKPILLKKHKDISYNAITINADGSDKIQNINSPLVTFTATSLAIKSPDQCVVLFPTTAGWEITYISDPVVAWLADLTTAGVNATNTEATLVFNNEDYDYGGYYSTSTGISTPLIAGRYSLDSSVYFEAGTSSEIILILYKNSTAIAQTSLTAGGNTVLRCAKEVYLNGTTDTVKAQIRSATATKGILELDYVTWFQGSWKAHY